jgi:hypothetical protein
MIDSVDKVLTIQNDQNHSDRFLFTKNFCWSLNFREHPLPFWVTSIFTHILYSFFLLLLSNK